LKQIKSFEYIEYPLRTKFLDTILSHCPKPSVELQRWLIKSRVRSDKYTYIERYKVRNSINTNSLLSFGAIHEEANSQYKPFITNIQNSELKQQNEMNALLSTVLALMQTTVDQTDPYFINITESMLKHVNAPEHKHLLAVSKTSLQTANKAITQLLERL